MFDVKKRIKTILTSFKKRTDKNSKEGRYFWSDDRHQEEGLQIACEGLDCFLIFKKDYLPDKDIFFPNDQLKKEADCIYNLWKEESFAPKPYEFSKLLKDSDLQKPEFVDTVTFVFDISVRILERLSSENFLDGEIEEKLQQMIASSLKWLVVNHDDAVDSTGWSGFPGVKGYSTVYATRAVTDILPLIELLKKQNCSKEINELIGQFDDCIKQMQKWFFNFAEEQVGHWEASTRKGAQEAIIYNLYGLDTLLNLKKYLHCELSEQVLSRTLTQILDTWNYNRALYEEVEAHLFKTDKYEIMYEDESILPLSVFVLSKLAMEYPKALIGLEYKKEDGEILNCSKAVSECLTEIINAMETSLYDRKEALWTNYNKQFTIYMNQRVLVALYCYDQYKATTIPFKERVVDMLKQLSKGVDELRNTDSQLANNLKEGLNDISEIKQRLNELTKALKGKSLRDIIAGIVEGGRQNSNT